MTQAGYKLSRDKRGLTKREREVLSRLVLGEQQNEIGVALGVSKQRVGQIVKALEVKGFVKVAENGGLSVEVAV